VCNYTHNSWYYPVGAAGSACAHHQITVHAQVSSLYVASVCTVPYIHWEGGGMIMNFMDILSISILKMIGAFIAPQIFGALVLGPTKQFQNKDKSLDQLNHFPLYCDKISNVPLPTPPPPYMILHNVSDRKLDWGNHLKMKTRV